MPQTLIVLTGAGISAESGIQTFRDANGLWENHRVEDVATPEAFRRNPALVLDFYNQRRRQARTVAPNAAHRALAEFDRHADWQLHPCEGNLNVGDTCPAGGQLRPHIVWFGEEVPAMNAAIALTERAAAGLLHSAAPHVPVYLVDKHPPAGLPRRVHVLAEAASTGVPKALAAIRAAG